MNAAVHVTNGCSVCVCVIIELMLCVDWSQDKDVAHFWELGGGTWLSKLADLTITNDTLRSADDIMSLTFH